MTFSAFVIILYSNHAVYKSCSRYGELWTYEIMLEHFFGSKTRLKLLKIFFRSPEQAFYVRELARLAETQLHAIRREISNLERMSLIVQIPIQEAKNGETGTERSKYYQLHTASFLHAELKALLLKAELMEEKELIEEIKQKGGELKLFILTGLFTEEKEVSTDILLVGKLKPLTIAKLVKRYEAELGKTIRYALMDEKEFKDRREIGDKFLYSVFEAKHILIVNEYQLS